LCFSSLQECVNTYLDAIPLIKFTSMERLNVDIVLYFAKNMETFLAPQQFYFSTGV